MLKKVVVAAKRSGLEQERVAALLLLLASMRVLYRHFFIYYFLLNNRTATLPAIDETRRLQRARLLRRRLHRAITPGRGLQAFGALFGGKRAARM